MPRTKLIRRGSALAPILPTPFLPSPRFPSLMTAAEDFAARANEMIRTAFEGMPERPTVEWFPAVNVSESKDEYTLTAELPGLAAKDVTIDFTDGVLTIRGEKKEEKEEKKEEEELKWYMWERRFGAFQRSLPFPGGVAEEKIAAEFKDGVLTVHLPKVEEVKAKHHEIPINAK